MPHTSGYRARTRKLFARDFRKHGMPAVTTYLTNFRVGDLVDIGEWRRTWLAEVLPF